MTDITVYQPPPPTHPARELAAALLRRPATWAVAVTLLAFGLRVVALADVPPSWRDDELIETLVISRNILGGDLRFYYPDASGHEALYHALNALFLAWFGPGALGIRLLSAFLGTLAVPLTYALARRLFGPAVGGMMIGSVLSERMAGRWSSVRTVGAGFTLMFAAVVVNAAVSGLLVPGVPVSVLPIGLFGCGMAVAVMGTPSV